MKPSYLEGVNYPYWKARMKVFIKTIDEKAWRSILIGWGLSLVYEIKISFSNN